jgi:hypothetical protein
MELSEWSKVVSDHYYRNLVTSLLVFDFYRMREDASFDAQVESAAGELLERAGIDDRTPSNQSLLEFTMARLRELKDGFTKDSAALITNDPDAAFLQARQRTLDFLASFNISAFEDSADALHRDEVRPVLSQS